MAEYYMPKPGTGLLNKIWTWLKTGKRFRPSFPRTVEFQTLSVCNAKCIFCPHSQSPMRRCAKRFCMRFPISSKAPKRICRAR